MRRVLLIATVLLISVVSTACINNFAVQELNVKAKEFMDKGDYLSAIERLKSSTDLAPNTFETWYNLAVAYTKTEDYVNAINAYNKVIELSPEFADAYYSLGICEENLIIDMQNGDLELNSANQPVKVEEFTEDKKLSEQEEEYILELRQDIIRNYQKFMQLSDDDDKKQSAQERINEINNKVDK